ncbi:MAG TPA: biotin/lipoyl-containing protein [Candidatus Krumholzibacteria bacterium]|nr:biotin/lipoyl-containing protein [Candidatus Krumholzibacteria bacterium]
MAKIVLDGIAREVVLERTTDGIVVVVDGRRHEVRDVIPLSGSFSFMLGSESRVVFVSNNAGGTQLSLCGRTYLRADARVDTDAPAIGVGGASDGRVQAPMPGGIIALHVKEGDHVTAGQSVAVLESMKMHNEITSPMEGVVRRVHTKVGEQVPFGHVLVEVAAEGSDK